MLEEALDELSRPVLVADPGITAPHENRFLVEPGRLADRTGIVPEFFGEPFHDIFGAQCAGLDLALIMRFGLFAGNDAERAVASTGIVPDFIAERT